MNAACPIRVRGRARAMETDTVFVEAEGLSPLPGLAVHGGTEPSAYALGYHLSALRDWGYGLGQGWWAGFVSLGSLVES